MQKYFLIISILTIIVIACESSTMDETSLTFTTICKSELYGNGEENIPKQNIVIRNESDWNELMLKMNSENNVTEEFTETNIDFSKYMIIAVFDELKTTGGHSIDITNITEKEAYINVTVENLLTGGLITVITQPFHIVKIEKSNKPIVFE